jgi:hypothetical protein
MMKQLGTRLEDSPRLCRAIREAAVLAWPACLRVTSPKRTRWKNNSLSTSEPQERNSLTMFLRWRDTFYTAWFNAIGYNCHGGELA